MRITLKRALRYILVCTLLFAFVVLNLPVFDNTPASGKERSVLSTSFIKEHNTTSALSASFIKEHNTTSVLSTSFIKEHNTTSVLSTSFIKEQNTTYHSIVDSNDSSQALKAKVERINKEQYVHNLDKFNLHLGPESLVFVIQTHDRQNYLKILLDSMRKVRDIETALLIISHDVHSPQLNSLVEAVDFCPVMQIFFPYSQQIFKHEFPGEDPNDCPRNIKPVEARIRQCNNADYPDKYGHYREAKYCQAKHHWIWKLRYVFEDIHVLKGYEGNVMLLEEDYFLAEDIIISTNMLKGLRDRRCPQCQLLLLGNEAKVQNYAHNGGKVERNVWIPSNMGMAFNRSLWEDIKKCAKEFCMFDDYNWDWTLKHISFSCIPSTINLLVMRATRVFHIGECGMHKKSKNCDPKEKVKEVESKLAENRQHLYPKVLTLVAEIGPKSRDPRPNGGWGDKRDHLLCLQYFNISSVK